MGTRESVGRYRIISTLGRGSMGLVYLAEDPLLNRRVAIKMVDLAEASDKEESRERLLRDAKAVAILSHPNIVQVHDVIQEDESAFIVMEYIEGDTLSAYLKSQPVPETAFTVQVLRQMAGALDYAHSKGVIHRDIKPGNVMLGLGGVAKIVDFGIARMSNTRTSTPTGFVVGTAAYMSPEQFTGSALDGRADQYSLAAMGYEMMTGSTVFGEQPLPALAYKAVHETPPPMNQRNPSVSPAVNLAITKALAKSPDQRYRTCAEFVDALWAASTAPSPDDRATVTFKHPTVQPAAVASGSGSKWWVAALAAVVLSAGGFATWRASQGQAKQEQPEQNQSKQVASSAPVPVAQPETKPPADSQPSVATVAVEPPKPPKPKTEASGPSNPPAKKPVSDPAPEPAPPVELGGDPPTSSRPDVADALKRGRNAAAFAESYRLGLQQMRTRDYKGAIESFSNVIALQPKRATAYYDRGQAHQFLSENEAAIKDYDEAIRLKPEDALAYVGRGLCLARLNRDDEALADLNHALELRANLPAALNGRGAIELRRKQNDKAMRDFDAALAINPLFAPALRNRAAAKQAMGDKAGARVDRRAAESAKEENGSKEQD